MARKSNAVLAVVENDPVESVESVEKVDNRSLGELIDRLEVIRRERKKLADKDAPLEDEYKTLKVKILASLDAQKSLKASSRTASVSVSEPTVPVVKDISKLVAYISRNKLWHLFLSQPLTTPAWREAVELKGSDLPGTETFKKRDINHSSIK